ncbi:MAG: tkt 3 [Lacrimispora sp.]|jgi:transketolase|nr:tkt 3 [Lacrimispora sp.]
MSANMNDLTEITYELRQNVLDIVMSGKGGHIGGDMSVLDILTVLYFRVMNVSPDKKDDPGRDRFIMSKGHSVEALYAVLAAKGFFPLQEVLDRFSRFGSPYIGHPNNHLPGIEMNSGSLGHGLPVSVGMALAGKMDQASYRVYTVMGDGELAEGSVWEAAMAAGNYKLDNLCATIDRNHLQISGETEEVMKQNSLKERFEAFGWNVIEATNGNDTEELFCAYTQAAKAKGKPSLVIASTVKGFGSSIMENKLQWHHRVPTEEEYIQISKDLKERKERIRHE